MALRSKKRGKGLLVAAAVGATVAGCPWMLTGVPAHYPDGGVIPGCFCGNAASACYFEDGGICLEFSLRGSDAGTDAGSDGGTDAGVDGG
jgi:hypothetical protein